MTPITMLDITKANDMQFVYCAFCEEGDDVYVKIGRSSKPFQRLGDISTYCPFVIKRAVYASVGSLSLAESIERLCMHELKQFRLRGEWYKFKKNQGKEFTSIFHAIYRRKTKRELRWTHVDMDLLRDSVRAAAAKAYAAMQDRRT